MCNARQAKSETAQGCGDSRPVNGGTAVGETRHCTWGPAHRPASPGRDAALSGTPGCHGDPYTWPGPTVDKRLVHIEMMKKVCQQIFEI